MERWKKECDKTVMESSFTNICLLCEQKPARPRRLGAPVCRGPLCTAQPAQPIATPLMILYVSRVFDTPKMFMLQRLNDCLGMGRNGNWPCGNGREWECKKPFPIISNSWWLLAERGRWRKRHQKLVNSGPSGCVGYGTSTWVHRAYT